MTAPLDAVPPAVSAVATEPTRSRRARKPARKPVRKPAPKPSSGAVHLAAELETLHSEWRKSATAYRLQTDARFLELRGAIAGKSGAKIDLGGKDARRLADAVRAVKLKPKKGRLRDLRAVDRALKSVLRRVDA